MLGSNWSEKSRIKQDLELQHTGSDRWYKDTKLNELSQIHTFLTQNLASPLNPEQKSSWVRIYPVECPALHVPPMSTSQDPLESSHTKSHTLHS